MMMDLPSSDQASSKGPSLIPIVGNNIERGGESVLASQYFFIFIIRFIYATSFIGTHVYTQLWLRRLAYIL